MCTFDNCQYWVVHFFRNWLRVKVKFYHFTERFCQIITISTLYNNNDDNSISNDGSVDKWEIDCHCCREAARRDAHKYLALDVFNESYCERYKSIINISVTRSDLFNSSWIEWINLFNKLGTLWQLSCMPLLMVVMVPLLLSLLMLCHTRIHVLFTFTSIHVIVIRV